jgi:GGDEF domain-containing protein
MNDSEKVAYLSNDPAFGILTRPALELALSEQVRFRIMNIYVLDLARIHKLNALYGYEAVNEKVRRILRRIKRLYPSIIMGRVFSGDELALVYPAEEIDFMINVVPIFKAGGIGFKYRVAEEYLGKSPQYYRKVIGKCINALGRCEYYHAL